MNIQNWLEKHAEQVPSSLVEDSMIWVTKTRGDYLTIVGMEDKSGIAHLVDLIHVASAWEAGKPVNIGFNPKENKWYGWSHRALCGFGIGSEVKRGDCAYMPTDKEDFLQDMILFWSDEDKLNITGEHKEDGVYIEWEYNQAIPNKDMRGKITGNFSHYPETWGRGEWKAKTLADARQMAIDFAESVS